MTGASGGATTSAPFRSRRARWRARWSDAISVSARLAQRLDELLDGDAMQLGRDVFGKTFLAIRDLRRRRRDRCWRRVIFPRVIVIFIFVAISARRQRVTVWTLAKMWDSEAREGGREGEKSLEEQKMTSFLFEINI